MDEEIRNIGPLKSRGCSDFLFTIIFLAFVGIMGYITYFALIKGDPDQLVNGVDSDGNICGQDESVLNYPYLYYMVQAKVTNKNPTAQSFSKFNGDVTRLQLA